MELGETVREGVSERGKEESKEIIKVRKRG